MIMTIFDSLSAYWTSFVEAPLGFQLVLGAGAITAFGAAKTGWKILFPVRWVAAKTLRGTAWLLHHTENAANNASNRLSEVQNFASKLEGAIMPQASNFDVSTKEAYLKTLKFYNKKKNSGSLTDSQLDMLLALGRPSVYKTKDKLEYGIYAEKMLRDSQLAAKKLFREKKDKLAQSQIRPSPSYGGFATEKEFLDYQERMNSIRAPSSNQQASHTSNHYDYYAQHQNT
tara:strand:- start:190 stop:876 length:687 start_codon:yes stop_codon:yes gene_type:complete